MSTSKERIQKPFLPPGSEASSAQIVERSFSGSEYSLVPVHPPVKGEVIHQRFRNFERVAVLRRRGSGKLGLAAGDRMVAVIFRGGISCWGRRAATVQIEKEQVAEWRLT